MKKLLLISLLTLVFCTLQLSAMEEQEDGTQTPSSNNAKTTITFEEEQKEQDSLNYIINCADEKSLEIDKSQFENLKKISGTIAHLMDDINDTTTLESNIIPLQQLESNVVQKILDLISTMPQEQTAEYTKFIEQLSQRPLDNLISLLNITNYLDIQPVLDLLSKAIAHKIIQEIEPPQQSLFKKLFSKSTNKSRNIEEWFKQNKQQLDQLPIELLNAFAIQIIENKSTIKSIIFPSQVLTEHTNWINCLAFSPDGNTIASGSCDNTIRIWTKNSDNKFSLNHTLTEHTNWINCLAFSPDGNTIASGSNDNTINIWTKDSSNTFSLNHTLKRHTNWIRCLAFSPDGNTIASGSDDKTIQLWEKLPYKNFSLEQALVLLMWQQSKIDKTSFEVPQEESLRNAFEDFPDNLKDFLTNKEQ